MNKGKHLKHKILSRIIAMVIIKGLILSGLPGAYCGELLCQKTEMLSPHINLPNNELQQIFGDTVKTLKETINLDRPVSRRTALELIALYTLLGITVPEKLLAGQRQLTEKEKQQFERIKNLRTKTTREIAEVETETSSYKMSPIDQKKAAMWKEIEKEMQTTSEEAYEKVEQFLTKKRRRIYYKLAKLLKPMGFKVDMIMVQDIVETGLKDEATSNKGAQGPMQVMPETVKGANERLADWKKAGDRTGRYNKIYLNAVKLLNGSHRIDWKRINEPEYGRRVGITIKYLSYVNLLTRFRTHDLIYNPKTGRWKFIKSNKKSAYEEYLTTAELAAYNGKGEGFVFIMMEKYGLIPNKVFETKKMSPEEQAAIGFDSHQQIGWLEGTDEEDYNDQTRTYFLKAWRYYHAIQRFKKENPQIWNEIEPTRTSLLKRMKSHIGAAVASVGAFQAVESNENKIIFPQVNLIEQAI